MTETASPELERLDRDSLHVLPLKILPIQTPGLRGARLIKNARLETVVELFHEEGTGSGQLQVSELQGEFGWEEGKLHPDLKMLRRLQRLSSFDVYSLRISLREQGIEVGSLADLRLSPQKTAELSSYMTQFTRPLIQQIFGDDDVSIETFDDVIRLFRDPDIKKARARLEKMANSLEIRLDEVPKFLEDYGDIFLSLSYYRQCLDDIEPVIERFLDGIDEIRGNFQLRHDINLMNTCTMMQSTMNNLMAAITGRFENFDRSTQAMWSNINAQRFRQVERLIREYHTTIGGVLCSLSVKMDAWHRLFPRADAGGPVRRAEFIMSEMRQGMDKIQKIEDSAPMLAKLNLEKDMAPAGPEASGSGDTAYGI
ncbi:MAG: hypothetical protein ACPGNT_03925 [Rhodospirillales bacterium]